MPGDIRPMIPLGQFRDTFIIAIDDEGVAIIDQHVAHERVLFERVMQQLTAGTLESQRLLVPLLIDLSPASHQALLSRAAELERLGYELDSFGESTIKVSAMPALLSAEDSANGAGGAGRGSRRIGPRRSRPGRIAAHCCDDRVPRRREGQLPAHVRENDAYPRGAAGDGVFHDLPARPAGDVAAHASRNRKELRANLTNSRWLLCFTISGAADRFSACGCCWSTSSRQARWARIRVCSPSASPCFWAGGDC